MKVNRRQNVLKAKIAEKDCYENVLEVKIVKKNSGKKIGLQYFHLILGNFLKNAFIDRE